LGNFSLPLRCEGPSDNSGTQVSDSVASLSSHSTGWLGVFRESLVLDTLLSRLTAFALILPSVQMWSNTCDHRNKSQYSEDSGVSFAKFLLASMYTITEASSYLCT
jgi:hypothetical protein